MPGKRSRQSQVSGRIVASNKQATMGKCTVTITREGKPGRYMPAVIVYPKTDSRSRSKFVRQCEYLGVAAEAVEHRDLFVHGRLTEIPSAYKCAGLLPSLERLLDHPSVDRWHYDIDSPVPVIATGGGTLSERARRELRVHPLYGSMLPGVERKAEEIRRWVDRLPAADRAEWELAEAATLPPTARVDRSEESDYHG